MAEGANPDWFYTWNAPGNMIDGSAEKTERFRLMRSAIIQPVRRPTHARTLPVSPQGENAYMWEWSGVGPFGHMISPGSSSGGHTIVAPLGAYVKLRAYKLKEPRGGGGTSTAGDNKHFARCFTYEFDERPAATYCSSPKFHLRRVTDIAPVFSVEALNGFYNHTATAGEGGDAFIDAIADPMNLLGYDGGLYESLTTLRPNPQDNTEHPLRVSCRSAPGYEVVEWNGDFAGPAYLGTSSGTYTKDSGGQNGGVEFVQMQTLEVDIVVDDGGGHPMEAGHVSAGPASKYYSNYGTEHVNLTAHPHIGYYFTGWSGQGVAFLEDHHGDPDFETPVPLDDPDNPVTDPSIWVAMGEDWGDGGGAKAAGAGGGGGRAVAGDFEDIGGQLMLDKYVVLPTLRAGDLALLGSEAANEIVTISFWTKYIAPALTVIITCQEDSGGHIQAHHQSNRPMGSLCQEVSVKASW